MTHSEKEFVPLNIAVLTVSDTRTLETDTSGQYLADNLTTEGHILGIRKLLTDNPDEIRETVSDWIADSTTQVVLITGGTGFTDRDSTPEAVTPLFEKTVDGFGELFRHISYLEIGTSTLQSRCVAGLANRTLVFCIPGSTGACKTAWEGILKEQLDSRHAPCNFVPHVKKSS